MADDWKNNFTQEQLAIIAANTTPKEKQTSTSSWADDSEVALVRSWTQLPTASAHSTGKWTRCTDKEGSLPGGSPTSIGFACKAGGEAPSASPISSGTAAKVGMVNEAESHVGSHGSAAPIAGGFAAKVGGGVPTSSSIDLPVTPGDGDVPMDAIASEGENDDAGRHAPTLYTCEGTCREADGNPCRFPRSVLNILGFPQKTNGPCVPGTTWQGSRNRKCIDCYIEEYCRESTQKDLVELDKRWKTLCKKSHREAQKYNDKKKERAEENRPATNRQLSEQQQGRVNRWTAAERDILDAHPGVSKNALRKLVLARVKTIVHSFRQSLMLLGKQGEEMVEEAQKARTAHLTKLTETGECDLPHGKVLKDATLQFLSDLTPDGKNKELFLCRGCGFVAPNHLWHQAKKQNEMVHHFRCRRCYREYMPWKKDGRFCKFNKVLVNMDPLDPNKHIVTPAWWTETSEQLFINLLKEFTLQIRVGSAELHAVTYNTITKVLSEKVAARSSQSTIFEPVDVPAPYAEQVATLHSCKGYEHCDISPQKIEGFFFRNHMDVEEDEIFKDFELFCNELACCLQMGDV